MNRIFSKRQALWLANYERETGFEPMHKHDYRRGRITFAELVRKNASWFEGWTTEVLHNVGTYPVKD